MRYGVHKVQFFQRISQDGKPYLIGASAQQYCQCSMTGRNCLEGIFSVHLWFGSKEIFCQQNTPGVSDIPTRRTTVCKSQSHIHICSI